MKASNHLKTLGIAKFKGITSFCLNDLKRVNLIMGNTNLGKTSILQAMYLNANAATATNLVSALVRVGLDQMGSKTGIKDDEQLFWGLLYVHSEFCILSNLHKVKYGFDESGAYAGTCKINKINPEDNKLVLTKKCPRIVLLENVVLQNVKFVNAHYSPELEFRELGITHDEAVFKISLADYGCPTSAALKSLFGGLSKLELTNGVSKFWFDMYGELTTKIMSEEGDRRITDIIMALYSCKDGIVFIDDIDEVCDFRFYDRLWEVILLISKEKNCQVICTTRKNEMLVSYARAIDKLKDKEVTYKKLTKSEDKLVVGQTLDYETIQLMTSSKSSYVLH